MAAPASSKSDAPAPAAAAPAAGGKAEDKKEEGGLDEDVDTTITVVSKDAKKFTISRKFVIMSEYVKTTLEGDKSAIEVEVKNVTGDILKMIVEWLEYHKGKVPDEIKKPLRSLEMAKVVGDPWDAQFVDKLEYKTLFDIILAANFMDVKPLLHLGCAKVASLIKGKTHDEIRKIFANGPVKGKEAEGGATSSGSGKADEKKE